MQANSSIYPFESENVERKGENLNILNILKNMNILRTKRAF